MIDDAERAVPTPVTTPRTCLSGVVAQMTIALRKIDDLRLEFLDPVLELPWRVAGIATYFEHCDDDDADRQRRLRRLRSDRTAKATQQQADDREP